MRSRRVAALVPVFVCAVLAQTPSVPPGSVVNGASFAAGEPVAPGALVSIFGTELASATAFADSIPLSTALGDVSVTFNGIPAPLVAVHPTQINAQMPWNVLPDGVSSGSVAAVVKRGELSSVPINVTVRPFSPGIFSLQFGTGQAAVLIHPDNALAAPAGSVPGALTRPAKAGDILILFASGLGPVNQVVASGGIPAAVANNQVIPRLLVGGIPATVQFAGLSPQFVGVYQINLVVPEGVQPGGAVPLQIEVDGIHTTDRVTIAVQ